ncbi:MAG: hypothetical protein LPK45_06825 [Bacteroidota bacterium]|nr:hypothetical protein [Bacteroidota bacterium]MDX5430787.1 hypothetical protein [Bacteroidota bacterium]MDX5469532.1 hypothetical protein [Bacteroidota bacterium]
MIRLFAILSCFFLSLQLASGQSDSTQNGPYRLYNAEHQLIFQGHYRDGQRHGMFKEYDAQGLLLTKAKYKRGRLIWMQRYENGKIVEYIDRKGKRRKAKDCGC